MEFAHYKCCIIIIIIIIIINCVKVTNKETYMACIKQFSIYLSKRHPYKKCDQEYW